MFPMTKSQAITMARRLAKLNPDKANGYVIIAEDSKWIVMSYEWWMGSTESQYYARYALQDDGTVSVEFDD